VAASTASIATSTASLQTQVNSLNTSTSTIATSTASLQTQATALGVSTNTLAVSTGTLYTLANAKVGLSSITATAPITYNNATGGIGFTQNFSTLTLTSTFTVTYATTNFNSVNYSWPSSGTTGSYLQYVSTNTLQWGAVSVTGGGATAPYYAHGGNQSGYNINVSSKTYCASFDLPFSVTTGSVTLQINTTDANTADLYSFGIINMSNVILASTTARSWATSLRGTAPFDTVWSEGPVTIPAGQYAYCVTGMAVTAKLYFAISGSFLSSGAWDPTVSVANSLNGAFPASVTLPAIAPANNNGNGLPGLYFALH
jgi:hypothetical protein